MKALIINHSTNYVYGASKSLQLLLTNLDIEYDIVSPKSLIQKYDETELRKNFQKGLCNTFTFWLPTVLYIYGRESRTRKGAIYHKLINLLYLLNRRSLYKLCNSDEYDFVYLNSAILFPLIDDKIKVFIHIREIFKGNIREFNRINNKLKMAKGVFFIDEKSYEPFKDSGLNSIVLSNPFDMRRLNSLLKPKLIRKYDIKEERVVFSILGKIIFLKGVDLVINSFNQIGNDNALLFIVGDINGGNVAECKKLAMDNKNIRFIGELKDTSEIYKISDYIVRGDRGVGLGRTTYEGLYSSCDVIIPTEDGTNTFSELKNFQSKCHTYKLADVDDLTNVMKQCSLRKVIKNIAESNVETYIDEFYKFLKKCI